MTAITEASSGALGPLRRRVADAYGDLSDGQRWTITLAVGLTILFLSFGLRQATPFSLGDLAAAPAPEGARSPTPDRPVPTPPALQPPSVPLSTPGITPQVGGTVPAATGGLGVDGPGRSAPARAIVAVVHTNDGALPGRGDDFVASVFLPKLGVPVAVLPVEEAADELCTTATASTVVLASSSLPDSLRNCLAQAGTVVLSHDEHGTEGRAISTRLAAADAIVDAVELADSKGPIGLAVAAHLGEQARTATAELERSGYRVETALVPAGDAQAMVSGIRTFAAAGVQTVTFAMPVADQSTWMTLESALAFRPAHLVTDVADAIVNESYPPLVDGALAVTATRVPWFARTHGETAPQAACRSTYEAAAPEGALSSAQLARVFTWCQHVDLLRAALAAAGPLEEALQAIPFDSPLTSPLGVRDGRPFGPAQLAVLAWDATCRCWEERTALSDRPGREP